MEPNSPSGASIISRMTKEEKKMPTIIEAKKTVTEFLEKNLGTRDVEITKVERANNGWEVRAEVYVESSFMKALGKKSKLRDKNVYSVKLDEDLEIESYEKN